MSLVVAPLTGHDRDTGAADRDTAVPTDSFGRELDRLRLDGAIFLRGEFAEAWAYRSMTGPVTAGALRPGAASVVLFHVVARGALWVAGADGVRHWARAGDVVVLPYADQHSMGGTENAEVVPIESIMQMPPWETMPVVRHGQSGRATEIVCGYLYSTDPLFDPRMRVFPPVFVVRPPAGAAADWVRANIAYAVE